VSAVNYHRRLLKRVCEEEEEETARDRSRHRSTAVRAVFSRYYINRRLPQPPASLLLLLVLLMLARHCRHR